MKDIPYVHIIHTAYGDVQVTPEFAEYLKFRDDEVERVQKSLELALMVRYAATGSMATITI